MGVLFFLVYLYMIGFFINCLIFTSFSRFMDYYKRGAKFEGIQQEIANLIGTFLVGLVVIGIFYLILFLIL